MNGSSINFSWLLPILPSKRVPASTQKLVLVDFDILFYFIFFLLAKPEIFISDLIYILIFVMEDLKRVKVVCCVKNLFEFEITMLYGRCKALIKNIFFSPQISINTRQTKYTSTSKSSAHMPFSWCIAEKTKKKCTKLFKL